MGDQGINLKEIKEKLQEINLDFNSGTATTRDFVEHICKQLKYVLTYKNTKYRDSALNPIKVFSKQDSKNSLYVRADDKISRIMNNQYLLKNDVADLMGYCVLICIDNKWFDWSDLLD